MASRIIFLGTAGDSIVAGKQIRASGGIVIKSEEYQLHIDPGPGAIAKAAEFMINLRENTAVLVSNSNILNCNDVNASIDAMTYGGLDKKGVLVSNKTVVSGTDAVKAYLTNHHAGLVEKTISLVAGQRLGIEDIEINAIATDSDDPNGVGYKIITNDFVLGYTSDTKYSKEIAKNYHRCDILIINVPLPGSEKEGKLMNSEDAAKFIREADPRLAIITHFGIKMIKADPLFESREIEKKAGLKVVAAKDGMSLVPESYSAEARQKRLNIFKNKQTGEVSISAEDSQKTKVVVGPAPSEEKEKDEKQEHLS